MIEFTRQGAIARLRICRAEKKNAMTQAMWQAVLVHCTALTSAAAAGDADTPRVLLLEGTPGAFCAGADIAEMQAQLADPAAMAASNAVVAQAQAALARLPLPTLAVIDGPCFGGGFGLAAACDFRIGSTRSRFAVTPARLGLLYSLEDTQRVLALIGAQRARRLLMRAERLDAATALAWGALDALVEAEHLAATAEAWASHLAAQSRTAMAGIKATLACLAGDASNSEPAVRAAFTQAFLGPDFAEGAAAFLARREPEF